MTVRLIQPHEWASIAPIFEQQGGQLPHAELSTAAVLVDDQGDIAGFWVLQQVWHAGPLWLREDVRGTGAWRKLGQFVGGLFGRKPGSGYYSFSDGARMDHVFAELGYRPLGYTVWAREVK